MLIYSRAEVNNKKKSNISKIDMNGIDQGAGAT